MKLKKEKFFFIVGRYKIKMRFNLNEYKSKETSFPAAKFRAFGLSPNKALFEMGLYFSVSHSSKPQPLY